MAELNYNPIFSDQIDWNSLDFEFKPPASPLASASVNNVFQPQTYSMVGKKKEEEEEEESTPASGEGHPVPEGAPGELGEPGEAGISPPPVDTGDEVPSGGPLPGTPIPIGPDGNLPPLPKPKEGVTPMDPQGGPLAWRPPPEGWKPPFEGAPPPQKHQRDGRGQFPRNRR